MGNKTNFTCRVAVLIFFLLELVLPWATASLVEGSPIPRPVAIYPFSSNASSAPQTTDSDGRGVFLANALSGCLRQLKFAGLVVRGKDLNQLIKERVFQTEGPGKALIKNATFAGARSVLTGSYRIDGGNFITLWLRAIDVDTGTYLPMEYRSETVETRFVNKAVAEIARKFLASEGEIITPERAEVLQNFASQHIANKVWDKLNLNVCYDQSIDDIRIYLTRVRRKLISKAKTKITALLRRRYLDRGIQEAISIAAKNAKNKMLKDKYRITPELVTFTGRKRYAKQYVNLVLHDKAVSDVLRNYNMEISPAIVKIMNSVAADMSFYEGQCYGQQISYSFGPVFSRAFQSDMEQLAGAGVKNMEHPVVQSASFGLANHKGAIAGVIAVGVGRMISKKASDQAARRVAGAAGRKYLKDEIAKTFMRALKPTKLLGEVVTASGWLMICNNVIKFFRHGLERFLTELREHISGALPQLRTGIIANLQQKYIKFFSNTIITGQNAFFDRYAYYAGKTMKLRQLTVEYSSVDNFVQTCRGEKVKTVNRLIAMTNAIPRPETVIPTLVDNHQLDILQEMPEPAFELALSESRFLPWNKILSVNRASLLEVPLIIFSAGSLRLASYAFLLHPLIWSALGLGLSILLFLFIRAVFCRGKSN